MHTWELPSMDSRLDRSDVLGSSIKTRCSRTNSSARVRNTFIRDVYVVLVNTVLNPLWYLSLCVSWCFVTFRTSKSQISSWRRVMRSLILPIDVSMLKVLRPDVDSSKFGRLLNASFNIDTPLWGKPRSTRWRLLSLASHVATRDSGSRRFTSSLRLGIVMVWYIIHMGVINMILNTIHESMCLLHTFDFFLLWNHFCFVF